MKRLLIVSLLLACAAAARAESGLTSAPILNRPVGARSSAMGRAFTAVAGDPEAVLYNPASQAFTARPRAYAAYMNGLVGSYGLLAAPVPVRGLTLTPAFLYYNSGAMGLNLSDGTTGSVTAELDKVGILSAAFRPLPALGLGASVKRATVELAETASASSLNFDAGALYMADNGFSFGAALLNAGQGLKFEDKADPAPRTLRAGAAWSYVPPDPNFLDHSTDINRSEVLLTADWSRTIKEKSYLQAGAELGMTMRYGVKLSLRAGYLFNRDDEGATFGFGLSGRSWDFSFGFETAKEMDARRPVSLSYLF